MAVRGRDVVGLPGGQDRRLESERPRPSVCLGADLVRLGAELLFGHVVAAAARRTESDGEREDRKPDSPHAGDRSTPFKLTR